MPAGMTTGERLYQEQTGYAFRKDAVSYDEFLTSAYANEMKRRFDYYQGNQFMFDPSSLGVSEAGANITPSEWNAAMSGYGWEDIRAMLPQVTEEQCISPVGIPFVTVVIDNKAVVYTVPSESRDVYFGTERDEKTTELLADIYEACAHDSISDQFCKWVNLFDTAFQFVGWDPRYKRIVKRNLKPYEVYVVPALEAPGDLQHPDCFVAVAQLAQGITDREQNQRSIVWQCWFQDRFWYETAPGFEFKDINLTERGTNPNPYRDVDGNVVKPILIMHSSPEANTVYFEGSDGLVLNNQRLDRDFTALSYAAEFQGFALFTVKGMDSAEIAAQPWAPGGAFAMPVDAEADFKHPLSPVAEMLNAAVKKTRTFARMAGIDPEIVDPEVKTQSGVSKAHGRMVLSERREEQFPRWLPYERESYYVTACVWDYHAPANLPRLEPAPRFKAVGDPKPMHLEITFGELAPVVDPLAETYEILAKLKANLITREEVIASARRLSPEAAKKIAGEIKKTNEADGIVADFAPASARIGQSGNRPSNLQRPSDKTGGNVSGFSGNTTVGDQQGRGVA